MHELTYLINSNRIFIQLPNGVEIRIPRDLPRWQEIIAALTSENPVLAAELAVMTPCRPEQAVKVKDETFPEDWTEEEFEDIN
jgi:hypothetical protein